MGWEQRVKPLQILTATVGKKAESYFNSPRELEGNDSNCVLKRSLHLKCRMESDEARIEVGSNSLMI